LGHAGESIYRTHVPVHHGIYGWKENVSTFRYQIIDVMSGELEGVPYRYVGRCLERVRWLNLISGENRYSMKPVRIKE
jgi:hypothetical protein